MPKYTEFCLSGSLNLLFYAGYCQALFLQFSSNQHEIWTRFILDHYAALKRQKQYLPTCKVSKYYILALHDSRPILGTIVGLLMYTSVIHCLK